MPQFGVGPELAAQCQTLPPPDGWRAWFVESDGPVPDTLEKRATALASDAGVPLGTTESYPLSGITALIRIEPRVWRWGKEGVVEQGCFRVGAVFLPNVAETVTPPSTGMSKLDVTVSVLTAASLVVGIGAALWGKS